MAVDIVKIDSGSEIKTGTVVVGCRPTGRYHTYDGRVVYDIPPIEDIESKYEDRLDDPTYYSA